MYDMTQNRIPAPYELNQQSAMPSTSNALAYARGGRAAKHKGMTTVHMNPHEIRILDHLQGMTEHGPGGVKTFPHLEEIFKNRHIVESIHRHGHNHRAHHAYGGYTPAMQRLSQGGRNGDTELAMIGPRTEHLFNSLAGHPTRNPNTGHPEYFSIGPALSGMWNTFKGPASNFLKSGASSLGNLASSAASGIGRAASAAAPHIKNAASAAAPYAQQIAQAAAPTLLSMGTEALGNKFGNMGQMAGNVMSQGVQSALGELPEDANPYAVAAGQGIGRAAEGMRGGYSPSQAFGQGLQHFGSQIGGGAGNSLGEAGQSLEQGQNWGQAARSGLNRGFNELGGRQGMYESAGNIARGLGQGGFGGARQAAGNEMNNYMQRMMPRPQMQQMPQRQQMMPRPANQQYRPMYNNYPQFDQQYDMDEQYPSELYG